jgi:hypothetical protein
MIDYNNHAYLCTGVEKRGKRNSKAATPGVVFADRMWMVGDRG